MKPYGMSSTQEHVGLNKQGSFLWHRNEGRDTWWRGDWGGCTSLELKEQCESILEGLRVICPEVFLDPVPKKVTPRYRPYSWLRIKRDVPNGALVELVWAGNLRCTGRKGNIAVHNPGPTPKGAPFAYRVLEP